MSPAAHARMGGTLVANHRILLCASSPRPRGRDTAENRMAPPDDAPTGSRCPHAHALMGSSFIVGCRDCSRTHAGSRGVSSVRLLTGHHLHQVTNAILLSINLQSTMGAVIDDGGSQVPLLGSALRAAHRRGEGYRSEHNRHPTPLRFVEQLAA